MHACGCVRLVAHTQRSDDSGVSSSLCVFWGLNSGPQPVLQALYPLSHAARPLGVSSMRLPHVGKRNKLVSLISNYDPGFSDTHI